MVNQRNQTAQKLYRKGNIQSIADKLGWSYGVVEVKAREIRLKKEKPPPWTKQKIKLLKKLYPNKSKQDIANELGRIVSAVIGKAFNLGLGKPKHI